MEKKTENLSIVGNVVHQLKLSYKIGIALFIIGLIFLLNSFKSEFIVDSKTSRIIAFSLLYLGGILFTFQKRDKPSFLINNTKQKLGLFISYSGLLILLLAWIGIDFQNKTFFLSFSLFSMAIGILLYTWGSYGNQTAGIKNNYTTFRSFSSRGVVGWVIGIVLTVFYIQLYWFSKSLSGMISLFDPFSELLRNKPADQWFVYGTLYTFVILFLGFKFIIKYRHNRYQIIRTIAVIFSQLIFAYFIPQILEGLNYDSVSDATGNYLGYYSANPVNTWPLNYSFFDGNTLNAYAEPSYQPVGVAYLVWGIILFLVVTPFITYLVGKRWYCSWICGCGGLAETAGDSFRQLSSKSTSSWEIERWVIHSVMVFVLLMTLASLLPYFMGKEYVIGLLHVNKQSFYIGTTIILVIATIGLAFLYKKTQHKVLLIGAILFFSCFVLLSYAYFNGTKNIFLIDSKSLKRSYGFFIGSAFSGVIGVGFYPILGNRVWCRFGCPMAGYMGLFQRFKSRFRITTNGGQCISCGNCSTYCEQGIDVRAYAQKGENIVRSSCVGCGICSAVCPRGVLKLENGPEEGRFESTNPIQSTVNQAIENNNKL